MTLNWKKHQLRAFSGEYLTLKPDIEIYGITYNTDKTDEAIAKFIEITKLYSNCLFLTKGSSFSDILLSDSLGNAHNADIEFTWNNIIKITIDKKEEAIIPERIYIFPECSVSDIFTAPYDRDFIYKSIEIYDKNGRMLDIRRQKTSSLLLGEKRIGFYLKIGGKVYKTGHRTPFDY